MSTRIRAIGVIAPEGEVLDMLVQSRHDSQAALRPMRKLLKKYSFTPKLLVTDKLRSYASAFRRLRLSCPTNKGSDKTIGRRPRIRRCDDASAKCSGSRSMQPAAWCRTRNSQIGELEPVSPNWRGLGSGARTSFAAAANPRRQPPKRRRNRSGRVSASRGLA